MNKVVLVSGASSGLGLATASYLFEKGYIVYAGARSYKTEKIVKKQDGGDGSLNKVFLDVNDEQSIKNLVESIIQREGRIDVLVNCAAIIILGSVEDLSIEEFRSVIETNLCGTMRMCRSVLPHMREKGDGLIINFSSGAGLIGLPFQSAYCASKFAIEGFSETLRWEVKNFGIDVVVLEPGDSQGASKNYRRHAANASSAASAYTDDFKTVTAKFESDEANGSKPDRVARKVYKAVTRRKPAIRYNTFRLAEMLVPLKMILPTWFTEMAFFGYYNLKPKPRK